MSKEAMKLALEALEWINRVNAMDYEYQQKARESLNAIYEALAEQPAQQELKAAEAVGYSIGFGDGHQAGKDASPPAQRKPLTHEQRVDLLAKFEAHKHEWHAPAILIDMVEAAHGIGEKK